MPKEWVLNQATNRWGLNKKRNVGPTSESIRRCAPKNLQEWEGYYYKNIYAKEHLIELGRKLYVKVSEVLPREIEDVTEDDCIAYIQNLVIHRTYDGYRNEIATVYGQLDTMLGVSLSPAPDEWDRLYNVDFYIQVNDKYIGIQIKPTTFEHMAEDYKWKEMQASSHKKFTKRFGGEVFIVFSVSAGPGKKEIKNSEDVIPSIRHEIERLSTLS